MTQAATPSPFRGTTSQTLRIPLVGLWADVRIPRGARGLVVFSHGSGSSRRSPRNREVAEALLARGFATLLLDLLTPEEETDRANVFDVDLLGERLIEVIDWTRGQRELGSIPLALFGASTGAAAAIHAAAKRPDDVKAVVSRGGRPDLAGEALARLRAPTLLIVGGRDDVVLDLNREALDRMTAYARLQIVPGATHLFEEAGAMEEVVRLALDWFESHLAAPQAGAFH